MENNNLTERYRPKMLDDFRGNDAMINALDHVLSLPKEKLPHAFLLSGPTGCGKSTLAKIIANELGCSGSDCVVIDAGLTGGVDVIRELRSNMLYKPLESACRVWIIEEAHKLTKPFQDGMLLTIENPSSHNFFILCTTNPNGLLNTVRGRCSSFPVKLLTTKEMTLFLKKVCKVENELLDESLIQDIVEQAEGHPRNALMILEQVLSMPPTLRAEIAQFSMETKTEAFALAQALFTPKLSWKVLANLIKGLDTSEAETVRRIVMAYANKVLLDGQDHMMNRCISVMEHFRKPTYDNGLQDITYYCHLIYQNS